MTDRTSTPPGLEALANHFGFAVVVKDPVLGVKGESDDSSQTSETSEVKKDEEKKVEEKKDAEKDETEDDKSDKKDKSEDKDEEKKPDVPIGSLNSFVNIYKGDNDDDSWTADEPKDTKPAENEETACHAIVLRNRKSTDSRKKYELHSIVVQSPSLKTALGEILKGYPGVFCNLDRLVFKAPFEPFVHRWGELKAYMAREDLDQTTREHIDLLHTVLRAELKDTIKAFEDYVAHGVVTFEHAWTIFQPGAVILSATMPGEMSAFKFSSGAYVETRCGPVYRLWCRRVEWDGKRFGWNSECVDLSEFRNMRPIKDMSVFPLAFHPKKEAVKAGLIERGRLFENLAGNHYKR